MSYDAGILNDFGGGNIQWWHDYIRSLLNLADEHYSDEILRYEDELMQFKAANERLKESLEDMVCQFAFWANGGLITGGLSALELAFDVLGWDEPHKVKSMQCDEPGCKEKASCGWKSENGYRNTCFKHKQALKETKQ